jgi:hypothetical protein
MPTGVYVESDRGDGRVVAHRTRLVSADTKLLTIGIIVVAALVAYVGYGLATQHLHGVQARPPTSRGERSFTSGIAAWEPVNAKLSRLPGERPDGSMFRVAPASLATFGVQIPTIVLNPTNRERVTVSIWLKAVSTPRIVVAADEFRAGVPNHYIIDRGIAIGPTWRHVTFSGRVQGNRWSGLGLEVYSSSFALDSSFDIRGLTVHLSAPTTRSHA